MNRREFLLRVAGITAGIMVPELFFSKESEAAIEIYRGSHRSQVDADDFEIAAVKIDRPVHPDPGGKARSDREYYPSGYYYENRPLNLSLKETYLQFGPLQNRLYTDSIVIHHIGNTDADVDAATVHQWHRNQGWSGVGYHFLVRKDGTIERGRPQDTVGAHTYGHNDHTIGVNIVGNFEVSSPTAAQLESASALVAALCEVYRIYPSAATILGHRDLCRTACPGRSMYARLPQLITMVQQRLEI